MNNSRLLGLAISFLNFLLLAILTLPFLGTKVFAGVRIIGNGGDVLVCKNDNDEIERIELLDHFEARELRGLVIDLGPQNLSIDEKVQLAISRLQKISPDRAELYKRYAENFFSEALFNDDLELVDIPDSDHSIIPRGCKAVQIANQATVLLPGQKRYIIDNNLWKLLDDDQKAGLILHELVYQETLNLGHNNSVSARYLSALMASPTLNELSTEVFLNLMQILNFKSLRIQGALIDITNENIIFNQNGNLKSAYVVDGSQFFDPRSSRSLSLRDRIIFNQQAHATELHLAKATIWQHMDFQLLLSPQILKLQPNGELKLAVLDEPTNLTFDDFSIQAVGHIEFYRDLSLHRAKISSGIWKGIRINSFVSFYENGSPKTIKFIDPYKVKIQNKIVSIIENTSFYSSGKVKSTYLKKGAWLLTTKQQNRFFKELKYIFFNEKSLVVER